VEDPSSTILWRGGRKEGLVERTRMRCRPRHITGDLLPPIDEPLLSAKVWTGEDTGRGEREGGRSWDVSQEKHACEVRELMEICRKEELANNK